MDPPQPDLSSVPGPGEVVAEKYEIERLLGAGGMGAVVAARHRVLGTPVAIKFLLPAATRLPDASARFLREAKAAAAITSEHVARVLDMGTSASGAPYLVMEYLSGGDLGRLVKARGPLPPAEAIDLVLQGCEAIAEAHALGIVHRDLKLGNLFLTARADGSPLVKVLDFGLSKTIDGDGAASEASLTATGVILGSPYYMSPEQIRSLKTVDARADIWALGVILYVMLSARRPFGGETASAICASVAADVPAPLVSVRSDLPPALDAVIGRCLEKDVARRFQSVAELACALAPFGSARSAISVERIVRVLPGAQRPPGPAAFPAAPEPTQSLPFPAPSVPLAAHSQSMPLAAHSQSMPLAAHSQSMPFAGHSQSVPLAAHSQSVPLAAHSQSMPLAAHSQSVPLAAHSQSMPLAAHSQSVSLAAHSQSVPLAAEPPPPRGRSGPILAAAVGGAVLGALGLVALVALAARPAGQASAAAQVATGTAAPPATAAVPDPSPSSSAEPALTAAAPPSASATAPAPPPAPTATAAAASPARRAPAHRKGGDPLLDRWK